MPCSSAKRLMTLTLRVGLLFALGPVSLTSKQCLAQNAASPVPLDDFLDGLTVLPIEYRADLQLRALEAQKSTQRFEHRVLLQTIYEQLSSAAAPFPEDYAATGLDTLERQMADGLMLSHLDGLSLRMRLLNDTAEAMPKWTIERLKELHLEPPRAECSTPLVPFAKPYFETVLALMFPADRVVSSRDIQWLQERISLTRSPVELSETATLLADIHVRPEQLQTLAVTYEDALQKSYSTDRELGFLTANGGLPDSIIALSRRLREQSIPSAQLLDAYQQFLRNSLESSRCQDSKTDWSSIARTFNNSLLPASPGAHPFFDLQDVKQQRLSGERASETTMPSGDEADSILSKMYLLRTGKTSSFLSIFGFDDQKSQMDSYAAEVLHVVDQLGPTWRSCETCILLLREKILLEEFDLLSDAVRKEEVLKRLVAIISSDQTQHTMPSLWNIHTQMLLNMARPVAGAQSEQLKRLRQDGIFTPFAPNTMQSEIRSYLRESHNPILTAYVDADEVFGTTFSVPYLR
jgi:hypothetical protein